MNLLWTWMMGCTSPLGTPPDTASTPAPDSAASSGATTPPEDTSARSDTAAPPAPLQGTVLAIYDGASNDDAVALGAAIPVTFEVAMIVADRGLPAEAWDLTAVIDPPGAASLAGFPPVIELEPTIDQVLVAAELTPLAAGPFRVSLYASSPTGGLASTTVGPLVEVGRPPPLRDTITYAGARAGVFGPIEVPEDQLERPQGRTAVFHVRNRTASACTVVIASTLARADGSTLGLSTGVDPGVIVEPGVDTDTFVSLHAEDAVVGEVLVLTAWPVDPCGGSAAPTVTEVLVGAIAP